MNSRSLHLALLGVILASPSPLAIAAGDQRVPRQNPERVAGNLAAGTRPDYVLQPEDVIKVSVFQHDDINKQCEAISISQEHTITLPMISTVSLKGKTARQAELLIRDLYDKDYLVNPQVAVQVLKHAERTVNVIGQVMDPGRIKIPPEGRLTIVDAISAAGGHTRLGDLKRVKLTRSLPNGGSDSKEIDVDAMLKPGEGREPIFLERDDVVLVPERRI